MSLVNASPMGQIHRHWTPEFLQQHRLRRFPPPLPINLPRPMLFDTPLRISPLTRVNFPRSQVLPYQLAYIFDSDQVSTEALSILLEFYRAQDVHRSYPYLSMIIAVRIPPFNIPAYYHASHQVTPPIASTPRARLYVPVSEASGSASIADPTPLSDGPHGRTPSSSHGGHTPVKSPSISRISTHGEGQRLDLS